MKIRKNSEFGTAGYCLAVFLFLLYFQVIGLYGLKFAVGAIISWVTGGIMWVIRILFQKAEDEEGVDKPFGWLIFLLFPLFIPLAMPLWIIPFVLVVCYFISIAAFGGHGRHIFNPVIVAVVFMLYGYGATGVLNASRPLSIPNAGYRIWTAGVPPRADIRDVFASVSSSDIINASFKGLIPNIPGSCFGLVILIASLVLALLFRRRIHWWLVAVGSVCTFAWLLPQHPDLAMPPINALLLGIMPSLILCGIADFTTLPESVSGQIIHAILFGVFSVLMLFNSADILAPAYGFLLAQVISPLIIDILGVKHE